MMASIKSLLPSSKKKRGGNSQPGATSKPSLFRRLSSKHHQAETPPSHKTQPLSSTAPTAFASRASFSVFSDSSDSTESQSETDTDSSETHSWHKQPGNHHQPQPPAAAASSLRRSVSFSSLDHHFEPEPLTRRSSLTRSLRSLKSKVAPMLLQRKQSPLIVDTPPTPLTGPAKGILKAPDAADNNNWAADPLYEKPQKPLVLQVWVSKADTPFTKGRVFLSVRGMICSGVDYDASHWCELEDELGWRLCIAEAKETDVVRLLVGIV
ncbi:hypothetical protein BDR26DRAFT_848773 [Obelidium mucronatum]|nr:hypothetical protein BDR26DRAFT_848773 [Obelidium mucronatum]